MAKLATGKVINWQPDPIQGHLNPRGRSDSISSELPNYCYSYSFWPQIFHGWVFHVSAGLKGIVFMATSHKGQGGELPSTVTARKERREFKVKKNPKDLDWFG